MIHKVIVVRSHRYPFESRWKCVCGVVMNAIVFGHPLNAEFNRHLEAVRKEKKNEEVYSGN